MLLGSVAMAFAVAVVLTLRTMTCPVVGNGVGSSRFVSERPGTRLVVTNFRDVPRAFYGAYDSDFSAGWPFFVLRSHIETTEDPDTPGMLKFRPDYMQPDYLSRHIGRFRPYWLGLALSSFVYWAVLSAGVMLVRAGRMLANERVYAGRQAAGLCVNCGYSVGGGLSICPECGEHTR
ncbi:MAG: hypothetical protein R3B57_06165 [Phycisphaerales bacterium]